MAFKLDQITVRFEAIQLVVGGMGKRVEKRGEWSWIGVDYLAVKWAEFNWWPRNIFWPDWDRHGKAAGPIRNKEMAEFAAPDGYCIAFWDGESKGTQSMIEYAEDYLPKSHVRIVELP